MLAPLRLFEALVEMCGAHMWGVRRCAVEARGPAADNNIISYLGARPVDSMTLSGWSWGPGDILMGAMME